MIYNYSIKFPNKTTTPIQITLTRLETEDADVHGIMFQLSLLTPEEIEKFADCLIKLGNQLKTK